MVHGSLQGPQPEQRLVGLLLDSRWVTLLLVLRHMVLDPKAPIKTLLPVEGYQIVVEWGI